MNRVINALKAIRILDEDGTVSFTSLYLYAALTLFFVPVTAESLGVITLVFAHANSKRFSRFKQAQASAAHNTEVETIKASVAAQDARDREMMERLQADIRRLESTQSLKNLSR